MASHIKPTLIQLLGNTYPLLFLTHYTGRSDCAYIMVEGKPIVSVSYHYGVLSPDSFKRAEATLLNYFENECKYCCLPSRKYGVFEIENMTVIPDLSFYTDQIIPFDIAMIDNKSTNVDRYNFAKTPHLFVEFYKEGKEYKFGIYDDDLMREIALRYNERHKQSLNQKFNKFSQESTGFNRIFEGIEA